MRLLYIAPGYTPVLPSSKRSVETSIYLLTKEMAKLGHSVTVVDIKSSEPRDQTRVNFCKLWSPPLNGSNIFSYFLKVLVFALQLPVVLYRHKSTDIIQTYSQFPTAMVIILKKLLRLKAPIIYLTCSPYLTMPSNPLNTLKHTLIEGWVLRRADILLVHTSSGAKTLIKRFRVNPSKVSQVFAGVDIEEIEKLDTNIQRDPALIFYPAVITPRKNQLALVETLPEVLKVYPGYKVILAGLIEDKNYYNEIQKLITSRGLSNITFTGLLTKPEVYELYQKATVMVFPTFFEMQGIILAEAMAFGLPVIASNIEVLREIVGLEEGCALLVNPSDSQALTRDIIKVLSDEGIRDQLSRRGKKLAYSRFSWNEIAKDMEEIYGRLYK